MQNKSNLEFYLKKQAKYIKFNKHIPKIFLNFDEKPDLPLKYEIEEFTQPYLADRRECVSFYPPSKNSQKLCKRTYKLFENFEAFPDHFKNSFTINDGLRMIKLDQEVDSDASDSKAPSMTSLPGDSPMEIAEPVIEKRTTRSQNKPKSAKSSQKSSTPSEKIPAIPFPLLSDFPLETQTKMIESFEAKVVLDKLTFEQSINHSQYQKFKDYAAKRTNTIDTPSDSGINSEQIQAASRINAKLFENWHSPKKDFVIEPEKTKSKKRARIRDTVKKSTLGDSPPKKRKNMDNQTPEDSYEVTKQKFRAIRLHKLELKKTSNRSNLIKDVLLYPPIIFPLKTEFKNFYGYWSRDIEKDSKTHKKMVVYRYRTHASHSLKTAEKFTHQSLPRLQNKIAEINKTVYEIFYLNENPRIKAEYCKDIKQNGQIPYLSTENFDFDVDLDTRNKANFVEKDVVVGDITNRLELVPIPAVSERNCPEAKMPPKFKYTVDYKPSSEVLRTLPLNRF